MPANAYEILSLAMRYVFAGLMVLIVLRAWRISIVDSRRAKKLRRLSPETGIVGEMLVVNGSERAKYGMRYPVTLEGCIGSGRGADIRVRHSSVRSRHAFYQMTDEGLFVRGHANARIRNGSGRLCREMLLEDGESLGVGQVELMLVLSGGGNAPDELNRRILRRRREEAQQYEYERDDEIFQPSQQEDYFLEDDDGYEYDGYTDEPARRIAQEFDDIRDELFGPDARRYSGYHDFNERN